VIVVWSSAVDLARSFVRRRTCINPKVAIANTLTNRSDQPRSDVGLCSKRTMAPSCATPSIKSTIAFGPKLGLRKKSEPMTKAVPGRARTKIAVPTPWTVPWTVSGTRRYA
jgi:hypothetical protein